MRDSLVYVADFGRGLVKIGCTRQPRSRSTLLAGMFADRIVQFHLTPRMPFAYEVEQAAIEWLGWEYPKVNGREWFVAPLEAAVACVNDAALSYGWGNRLKAMTMHPVIRLWAGDATGKAVR